ncbi:hypothetical protein POUND7_012062 [Theobroma cacao]
MMTMDLGGTGPGQARLVGDYILGPRIGSGSFAVVWRSRHRQHGLEVAVKEIDKKLLSSKVSENLFKEISILSTINHPNIIQFFEAIETGDKIFLVLEYCDGGDLAAYIHRHGKVSEEVARHFMRQLAAGLQVLQEKHLIHRDLKPQNLLLSTKGATPHLKIGDFGFARSLTPQDLADTLCGSPLYMAPEIIQNQKYDAKADLWSVGAILFQLVTGKPPFNGNNQLQLFQNILRSTELQFPEGTLEELHPDCVDLCRSLLRHNPVERLTFGEFFNHKFLGESSEEVHVERASSLLQSKSMVEQFDSSASEKKSQLLSGHSVDGSRQNPKSASSVLHDRVLHTNEHGCSSSIKGKSVDNQCSSDQPTVADSTESIEKDYVLVNPHFESMETFSYYLDTSLQDNSSIKLFKCPAKKSDQESAVAGQTKETTGSSAGSAKIPQVQGLDPPATSSKSALLMEVQQLSILHPSTRLQLLHQCAQAITELAQEKNFSNSCWMQYNAGLFLESFSVELVVLAIWKKALQICSSWMNSATENELPGSSSGNEPTNVQGSAHLSPNSEYNVDFSRPSSVGIWVQQQFIVACDHAEKLSCHLQDMDATAEMPDAMDIIYEKALTIGKSGAVDEYMENKGSAAASYSKAMLLLSFIIAEATNLPLKPQFSLAPADKMRIQRYINKLQSHQCQFLTSAPFPKLSADSHNK